MTDTKPIASLLPCGRRWLARNDTGIRIWCRPPVRPSGLSDAEAIKNPSKWFKKKQVSCETCLACQEQEPLRAPQRGFDISSIKDPIKDRIPVGWDAGDPGQPVQPAPKVLDDGTIIYEKVGWEPPPVPPGYRRQSDDFTSREAWILVRKEPLCKHCKLVRLHRASCNCLRVVPTCTRRGRAKNIEMNECDQCPNKQ